jgi:glycosyltransferase involved in cell wall biosynthesis
MRLCVASSGLGHVARGIESWAQDLGHELARRDLPVIVCKGGGEPSSPIERVIPCWTRESPPARSVLARLPAAVRWRLGLANGYEVEQTTFALNLLRVLRRESIDLLHVQDPRVALLVQKARSWGLVRTRTVLGHGTEEPASFLARIEYLQHLAPWHLEEARSMGVWRDTWTAIPNFVDTERFAPGRCAALRAELSIPADAFVVLSVAALKRRHKRIDHLAREAARALTPARDLALWLVVAGGWEEETDDVVREATRVLGNRVRFLVRFPRTRIPDLYRAADVFVLTSLKEMMPMALLEAMASGLPCFVHPHPVMQWMLGPGGWTVDMNEPGALASSLARLAGSARERQELGRAARHHCQSRFGSDRVVDDIVRYYDFVLQTRPDVPIDHESEGEGCRPR